MNCCRSRWGVAALSLLALTAIFPGCSRQTHPAFAVEPRPGVTSMQKDSSYDVIVQRLAAARCDQEQGCGNIGRNTLFPTRQACLDQLRGNVEDDLHSFDCPLQLNPARFEACAGAVAVAACGRPFETLARYGKCKAAARCIQ